MTKDEALKLALELLAVATYYSPDLQAKRTEVIDAGLKALAQPEQEPVIWMYQNKSTHEVRFQKHMRSFVDHGAWYEVPLYSEPLANQEKTSGSPKPAKPEALRLADAMEYDLDWCDEAAAELRRMHDLLGKANALCRIRAEEIERLKAQPQQEPVAEYIGECSDGSLVQLYDDVKKGTKFYGIPTTAHMGWSNSRRTHGNQDGHDDNIKPNGGSRSQTES